MSEAVKPLVLSIILPVFNEADHLATLLKSLQPLRQQACELIVVDGGSVDGSLQLAEAWVDVCLQGPKGRALQMNLGAKLASAEYLLFLHADSYLPAADFLQSIIQSRPQWGFFKVRLSGDRLTFRCIASMMNLRSRITAVATGDQALFMCKAVFDDLGGFPPLALMEDVALSKCLRKLSRPLIIQAPVLTSSRRWQQHGIVKTILLMWLLRLGFFLKFNPRLLHRLYYG